MATDTVTVKTTNTYKNWRPVFHSVIKDKTLAGTIHEKGYAVIPFLTKDQLNAIKQLYRAEHSLTMKEGGMFYSLYSKDLEYRKRIHEAIQDVLSPTLKQHFQDYKNIVNTFITKASGPESEFYVHQDTTALDEYRYSPLSVWIPLQDITPENGALAVIEKTHHFFSPYRGISFPSPFQKINSTLKDYLKPVYLKAGEAIVFDPRIIHNSMKNMSGQDRLVALCGIFPQQAEFITCYKEPGDDRKIERIRQDDTFILENDNFFYDCHSRPKTGKVIETVENDFPEMTAEKFTELCRMNLIDKVNSIADLSVTQCHFVAEPNGINRVDTCGNTVSHTSKTVWQKLKAVFN